MHCLSSANHFRLLRLYLFERPLRLLGSADRCAYADTLPNKLRIVIVVRLSGTPQIPMRQFVFKYRLIFDISEPIPYAMVQSYFVDSVFRVVCIPETCVHSLPLPINPYDGARHFYAPIFTRNGFG